VEVEDALKDEIRKDIGRLKLLNCSKYTELKQDFGSLVHGITEYGISYEGKKYSYYAGSRELFVYQKDCDNGVKRVWTFDGDFTEKDVKEFIRQYDIENGRKNVSGMENIKAGRK